MLLILKHYRLILKAALVSLILHYLLVMYFPLEWLESLSFFDEEYAQENYSIQGSIEATLTSTPDTSEPYETLEPQFGEGQSNEGSLEGIDQEKWGDLIDRLEENTGFQDGFEQTYEDLIEKSQVGKSYVYRNRHHEDIVVKDVFPTIHSINESFEDVLNVAPEQLNEFEKRNDIIEQYRSQNSNEQTMLTVEIIPEQGSEDLGPLHFPEAERQQYFDKTLRVDKTQQLSNFIDKYFQYDPSEGDLPIATRELYSKNLERVLYTFSTDPTYHYLDFYLENLNKEDFLHNALSQASKLDGSKTATELLFAIERIHEIQQRAWGTFYDFKSLYESIPPQKRNRLRVETLRRANERYRDVLKNKGITNYGEIEKKYLQRRYEILDHIVKNTPGTYRLQDALFEQGAVLWEMGQKNNDESLTLLAVVQWQSLISNAKQNNFDENAYDDFINLKHLKHLDALLNMYQNEHSTRKAVRVQQINNLLRQRDYPRHMLKRQREKKFLWPD